MKVQLSQICNAVKSTVPQEMWGEIIEKVEELEQHSEALDAETEAFDDDDEPYDPMEFMDEDDEFDLRRARRHRWRLWIAVGVDEAIAVAWMLLAAPAVVTRVSPR